MTEYFSIDIAPGKTFFRCDRMRATLSTTACSGMWRLSNDLDDGTRAACRCCPIGAVHAGEVAASMSPLKGTLTCARCHRSSTRLIGRHICVSCANRAYEVAKGRNAKGAVPVKAKPLDPRRIRYLAGGEVRMLRLDRSADTDELVVATLRDSRQRVAFGLGIQTPRALRQFRLWG